MAVVSAEHQQGSQQENTTASDLTVLAVVSLMYVLLCPQASGLAAVELQQVRGISRFACLHQCVGSNRMQCVQRYQRTPNCPHPSLPVNPCRWRSVRTCLWLWGSSSQWGRCGVSASLLVRGCGCRWWWRLLVWRRWRRWVFHTTCCWVCDYVRQGSSSS